ncbi:MAG: histidine ammonia-lyase [Bacilli bacterium]|jgi:histidine ammonia-lyase|nr:histidine ammonia-lyase [Bacilli bacterium]HHU24719.1 histidine ammonia-lyase [Acholeplasmataceae bacterium]
MIEVNGYHLNLLDFYQIAQGKAKVKLADDAIKKINDSHLSIKNLINNKKVAYGINTGFGILSEKTISSQDLQQLQVNLLKSHACGVGPHFDIPTVRGIMTLRINVLAKGYSGIRLELVEKIIEFLNNDLIPAIPEKGSLGASGDLAPLSHMALPLLGLGEVYYQGKLMTTKQALELAKIEPLSHLEAKEGLSLINGTQVMTSVGALVLYDAINLAKVADIAGGVSLEALRGIIAAFDERIHFVRGQMGQQFSAANIRRLTQKSQLITHQGELRVQDAYSLRCMAQVHGATKDALEYVLKIVELEMNAATDNPLILNEEEIISGGNFHGQPIALAFDFLKIAIAELASISERRIERLVNPALSEGLPAFLVAHPGLNSGFMIVQYVAASLVSENKILAHPAVVDSIPSSANQEDHVSMGSISALTARQILKNAQKVLAMELFTACQALDFRNPSDLGVGTKAAYQTIRKYIPYLKEDEIMYPLINQATDLVENNTIVDEVEKTIGQLH